jgi:hypothetical protein
MRSEFTEKKLEEMYDNLGKISGSEVQIHAIMYTKNKNNVPIWSARSISITDKLGNKIIENARNFLLENSSSNLLEYDPENDQSDGNTVTMIPDDQIPTLSKMISEINRGDNQTISFSELLKSNSLKGLAITIGKRFTIFNKVTRATLLGPKKYLFLITSDRGEFTVSKDENQLAIPRSIDSILYDDPLFVFRWNYFVQMFNFEETFDYLIESAKESLDHIVDKSIDMVNESKKQLRTYKKLATACAGYITQIDQKKVDLKPIVKDYHLDVSFTNGKIDIENSDLNDILSLLSGQAVRDAIFNEKYFAREKEKVS